MQRIIMTVIVLAAIGIVSVFAASQLLPSKQAGAAPPCGNPNPPSPCTPTPTASASPTATPTATPTSAPTPTPSVPPIVQAREDQITIFSEALQGPSTPDGPNFGSLVNTGPVLVALDGAEYPQSSTFQLEVLMANGGPGTFCARLFNTTTNAPVFGSEVCFTAVEPESRRLRSGPLTLPTGEHEYTVQGKADSPVGARAAVHAARVIAEWTELVP